MKKKTNPILKLVKNALRSVILEFKDKEIIKDFLPNYENVTIQEQNKIVNGILKEQRKKEKIERKSTFRNNSKWSYIKWYMGWYINKKYI